MWDRNDSDCVHGSLGCNPAYCSGRGRRLSWSSLLENGRGTVTGRTRSRNSSAEMDGMEKTAKPVPSHSNVVGEGGEEPNTENSSLVKVPYDEETNLRWGNSTTPPCMNVYDPPMRTRLRQLTILSQDSPTLQRATSEWKHRTPIP